MKVDDGVKKPYVVEKTSVIDAPPKDIFTVLMHLDRWNLWTESITEMSILNNDEPEPGSKIKVLQPKLPPAIWTITKIDPNKTLTWQKKSFGLNMRSEHLIINETNETSVTIRMTYEGPLAGLFYNLTRRLTDRYMTMEINGLKRECEKHSTVS
jgi:uncharacterized membrane protein